MIIAAYDAETRKQKHGNQNKQWPKKSSALDLKFKK